ncbi:uncharacterized protein LOC135470912 [Liolophura sinensis]|uniref:uncharacterized protein LOC135470912 n=1 Tax=Liolophura sinensis TaxID=3198878 RepID=UPI0031594642
MSKCYQNVSEPNYVTEQKVQNEATQWEMYLSLASGIPAMFMVIVLGAASDRLNSPLCWDSVKMGTNTAIDAFIHPIGLIILVRVLQNWLSDIGIAVCGALSSIAALLLEGLAINSIMMFIMYAVGMLSLTPMIFLKAILSKITEKENQGALFAGFGFIDCVSYIVGQFFYTMVYESTLNVKTGAVFLVMAGQYLVTLALLGVLYTQKEKLSSTKLKKALVN